MARLQTCPCGSGEYPEAQYDGYNIFMCYTCSKCEKKKLSRFRSDIFEQYDYDEPLDSEAQHKTLRTFCWDWLFTAAVVVLVLTLLGEVKW